MDAIDSFVEASVDPVYSAIVWREGTAALGWDGMRRCTEKYSLRLIETAASKLIQAGYFDGRTFDTSVRLIFHLFGAAAMTLAGATDKERIREECADVLKRMFTGLRTPSTLPPA